MRAWFGLDGELVERLVRGLGGLEPAEAVGSPRADAGAEHVSGPTTTSATPGYGRRSLGRPGR